MTANAKSMGWLGTGLFILYLLLYMFPLGNRPLAVPDETRYAEIPREMLASGDWITPRLNGLRYFEKPPLGYWLNAVSISLLGENPFAIRLSSAVAAGLSSLLIYLFTVETLRNQRIALLATFIHLTFFEVYIIGTFSVLDNLLSLFLTAGMMAFYLAVQCQKKRLAWLYWSASGISLGLAFLAKGFLALAVPVVVFVPWMIWQGHWKSLLTQGWYVVLIAVFVALPWGIMIHFQESDFWHYFFWVEHIKRFTAENAQHKAPFYYFLVTLPLLAYPWISFAPAAMAGLTSFENKKLKRLLWLWLLLPFLFFSLSSGKLVTYILPIFPALAILLAIGLLRYLQRENTRLFDAGVVLNVAVLILLLLTLLVSQFFDLGFSVYRQDEISRLILMVLTLLAGVIAGWVILHEYRPAIRLILCLFLVLPFMVFMQFATPDLLRESKAPGKFLTQFRGKIDKNTLIVSDGAMLRATNWFLKRDDVYQLSAGEVSYGLAYEDAKGRLLDPDSFSRLLANMKDHPIAVVCRKGCPQSFQAKFPKNSQRYQYGKFSAWYISQTANH